MIKVQVRPNEPLEAALRRFKRQCNFAGIFRLAKKYSFFEKQSDKNRREERERVRARQRAQRKANPKAGGRRFSRRKSKVKAGQSSDMPSNEGISAVPASQVSSKPAAPVEAPKPESSAVATNES